MEKCLEALVYDATISEDWTQAPLHISSLNRGSRN
jgi:hypothetical protein